MSIRLSVCRVRTPLRSAGSADEFGPTYSVRLLSRHRRIFLNDLISEQRHSFDLA